MSLLRSDICVWADLCLAVIRNKASAATIRKMGLKTGANARIPEHQHHHDSAYVRFVRLAKALPDRDAIAFQVLIDLAYEVARDLLANVSARIDEVEALRGLIDRNAPVTQPITLVVDVSRATRYSQRVDIYDRDDDGEAA